MAAGVPRLNTPPPVSSTSPTGSQERVIAAPKPIRVTPNLVHRLEDLAQPWTRSPTKSEMDPVLAKWRFISCGPSLTDNPVTGRIMFLFLRCLLFLCPFLAQNFEKK